MDTFTQISYQHVRSLTLHYSSSFGLSSRLFDKRIQSHIYAIYALVRIADEIVDTYKGTDQTTLFHDLETETYRAMERQYSPHPIVHAFALTATKYGIEKELIAPFFKSMQMDVSPRTYTESLYREYIHGSAEVIGLMCLRVFCEGDDAQYQRLKSGAASLGAAYQKVNFLRDIQADYHELQRLYFPGITYDSFDDSDRDAIVADIRHDFSRAKSAMTHLPSTCKGAVETSYVYYHELLDRLAHTPAEIIKSKRIRVPTARKLQLLAITALKQKVRK